MKIIKNGIEGAVNKYFFECPECLCQFTAHENECELEPAHKDGEYLLRIVCPCCRNKMSKIQSKARERFIIYLKSHLVNINGEDIFPFEV